MTFLRFILMAFILICTPVLVAAHGTGQHVLGVVTAIDSVHIEIKTPKGQSVSVRLTDKTQYKAKNLRRTKHTPQVGDRVVIEAEKDNKGLIATSACGRLAAHTSICATVLTDFTA